LFRALWILHSGPWTKAKIAKWRRKKIAKIAAKLISYQRVRGEGNTEGGRTLKPRQFWSTCWMNCKINSLQNVVGQQSVCIYVRVYMDGWVVHPLHQDTTKNQFARYYVYDACNAKRELTFKCRIHIVTGFCLLGWMDGELFYKSSCSYVYLRVLYGPYNYETIAEN